VPWDTILRAPDVRRYRPVSTETHAEAMLAEALALAAELEAPPEVTLPGPGEPIGFEAHIKQLFRENGRRSTRFAFDLWDHHDVATNAVPVLDRLRAGQCLATEPGSTTGSKCSRNRSKQALRPDAVASVRRLRRRAEAKAPGP
jgi:hypothetical protein